jgi:hypothetical protein
MGSKAPKNWPQSFESQPDRPSNLCRLTITEFAHKTGIIGDAQVCAGFAAFDMTAQGCRSATLDRRYDLQLPEAHVAGVRRTPSRPVVAKDVRHLDRRP